MYLPSVDMSVTLFFKIFDDENPQGYHFDFFFNFKQVFLYFITKIKTKFFIAGLNEGYLIETVTHCCNSLRAYY